MTLEEYMKAPKLTCMTIDEAEFRVVQRERPDGGLCWDVVVVLDSGYMDREDAEQAARYLAED